MFTGLVQETGTVVRAENAGSGRNLLIKSNDLPQKASIGDSISVNGCCLTVVEITGDNLAFEAGPETLD
ncbi:MAG: riboflavin synthase, partial [Hyphomicrobiales bacterium]|nr:riboflavin synthase [Hyphomicrobiales bacterium]